MLLNGVTALVAGASGEVGRGAAYALSQAGAYVYLAGRSLEKLQAIQNSLPNKEKSKIVAVDYSTIEGAKTLEETVRAFPHKLDVVVSCSGPWWPIKQIATQGDIETLYKATQSNLVAHLFLYKVLAPNCPGQYVMVNGTAALNIVGTGLTGVMANACVGAAKLMNDECNRNTTATTTTTTTTTSSNNNLPNFTHVLLSSSVGHTQFRGRTNDPNEFGKVFVAMALNKHVPFKDASGTLLLDDIMADKLMALL